MAPGVSNAEPEVTENPKINADLEESTVLIAKDTTRHGPKDVHSILKRSKHLKYEEQPKHLYTLPEI